MDANAFLTAGPAFASALFAGLTLLFTQLQHRKEKNTPSEDEEVRTVLLRLEQYVDEWARQAKTTNELAREWGEQPDDAGPAMTWLLDSWAGQSMWLASVEDALRADLPALIPPSLQIEQDHPTLERVLRVYAPELHEGLIAFSHRRDQLQSMASELERLKGQGPGGGLESYLADLDRAAEALGEARRRIAEFIAAQFPLGD